MQSYVPYRMVIFPMTLIDPVFKVMAFFEVECLKQTTRLRDKVTTTH